jgi:CheY-like chemotaxis protein
VEGFFVVEVAVHALDAPRLFLTGSGEAYRKTLGGTKKFTGAELFTALLMQLDNKAKKALAENSDDTSQFAEMPSVTRRAKVVRPLVQGSRILWVDDIPANNLYERTVLSSLGIATDLAVSTEEALYMAGRLKYDLIISDMNRAGDSSAGLKMLDQTQKRGISAPMIYYVGNIARKHRTPIRAFAITNRPDEVLHYVFDVLERRDDNVEPVFRRTKPRSG